MQLTLFDKRMKSLELEVKSLKEQKLDVSEFNETKQEFRHNHAYVVQENMKNLLSNELGNIKEKLKNKLETQS